MKWNLRNFKQNYAISSKFNLFQAKLSKSNQFQTKLSEIKQYQAILWNFKQKKKAISNKIKCKPEQFQQN